jgi:UrcA family protein
MKTILTLAALAAAATATPVIAQSAAPDVVRVSYADLDLRSGAGRAAFNRRIAQAVHDACGTISTADPRGANDAWRCRTELAAKLNRSRDALLAGLGSSGTEVAAR